jgi:protoporphyrinogen IX oxidase
VIYTNLFHFTVMLYIKALHIIFVVTWFAGLFYIVRLFVYAAEANTEEEPKRNILRQQFALMQRRLWYGITWPSAVLTFIFGHWVLVNYGWHKNIFAEGYEWLLVKYILVWLLLAYHLICHHIFKQQQSGVFSMSGQKLRVWNEVATLLLISIVFLVVVKNTVSLLYGVVGLVLIAILLMLAIQMYRKKRNQ